MANRSIEAKKLKMKRRGKHKTYSKAFVNAGKGPNQERMAEYYGRVKSMERGEDVLKRCKLPVVLKDIPRDQKIVYVDDTFGKLSLFFHAEMWVFVEEDKIKKTVRRSRIYSNKRIAVAVMDACSITWVE